MKKTIFHELYYSVRRDWDGWLMALIILGFSSYGVYWLSVNFDLNPVHWLSAIGDYVYTHGGTVSFIVMIMCIAAIIIIPLSVSAWKGATVTDRDRRNVREAIGKVSDLETGMKDLGQQLSEIQRHITEIRDILRTAE